jgi:hypothetical protein
MAAAERKPRIFYGTGAAKAVEVAVLGGYPALAFSDILIAA